MVEAPTKLDVIAKLNCMPVGDLSECCICILAVQCVVLCCLSFLCDASVGGGLFFVSVIPYGVNVYLSSLTHVHQY